MQEGERVDCHSVYFERHTWRRRGGPFVEEVAWFALLKSIDRKLQDCVASLGVPHAKQGTRSVFVRRSLFELSRPAFEGGSVNGVSNSEKFSPVEAVAIMLNQERSACGSPVLLRFQLGYPLSMLKPGSALWGGGVCI